MPRRKKIIETNDAQTAFDTEAGSQDFNEDEPRAIEDAPESSDDTTGAEERYEALEEELDEQAKPTRGRKWKDKSAQVAQKKTRGRKKSSPEETEEAEDYEPEESVSDEAETVGAVEASDGAKSASETAPQDEAGVEFRGDMRPGRHQRRRSVSVETKPPTTGENNEADSATTTDDSSSSAQRNVPGRAAQNVHGQQRQQQGKRAHNKEQREITPSLTKEMLEAESIEELLARAEFWNIPVFGMELEDLIDAIVDASAKAEGFVDGEGILDILSEGYGFLRMNGYLPSENDAYVAMPIIKRNGLRKGDYLKGTLRPARENDKYRALQKVSTVNGVPVEEIGNRVKFADLTPIYPDERLVMEHGKNTMTGRVMDIVSPIGKGQRGLIVSPPKAGKTTVLKDIAASITANNPEVHLMCLLVDERPEEVTDMQRSICGEVISSTFDMPCENHITVAELVIERAKRLVENGQDVVILLDSITRLARAYNLAQPASGRILSGGVDSTALYPPKKFLGAARNIENGGSLTILASALVETGSKMDEVIFEEFKGTGNMELRLDRNLADRRIFPAIDPISSGTRKEELLLEPKLEAPLAWGLRRILANMNDTERAMNALIKGLKQTDSNQEFLIKTAKKTQTAISEDEVLS